MSEFLQRLEKRTLVQWTVAYVAAEAPEMKTPPFFDEKPQPNESPL